MKPTQPQKPNKPKPQNPYIVLKRKYEALQKKYEEAKQQQKHITGCTVYFVNDLDVPVWVRIVRVFKWNFKQEMGK